MDAPIFYAPPEALDGNQIELPKAESHHAGAVMRLKRGDMLLVVDGLGHAYRGEISRIGRSKNVLVLVHARLRNFGEPIVRVTLAAGLSVGAKLDAIVQKATEFGIKRFVPILSARSRVKLEDPKRAASKIRRLEKVALAAIKQCRRSYRPEIAVPISFEDFVNQTDLAVSNLIFHPSETSNSVAQCLPDKNVSRVTLLVGPEAGFSEEEVAVAVAAGYRHVSLGCRVLRSETAAPVACALTMAHLGELS